MQMTLSIRSITNNMVAPEDFKIKTNNQFNIKSSIFMLYGHEKSSLHFQLLAVMN